MQNKHLSYTWNTHNKHFIIASQGIFPSNTSYDEPKRHIVLSGKRNIMGVEDKTDMSEDCDKFHEIPPFIVKTDPSIL